VSHRTLCATLPLVFWPALLPAQLGEVHLGAIASYGTAGSFGAGAGLIGGISAGRLVYVGARWVYFAGSSDQQIDGNGSYDVRTQAQIFAADVGLQYPLGAVELVAGLTIGATRFGQQTEPAIGRTAASSTAAVATEFLIAPNVSAQLRVGRLLLIPELMYSLTGSPDLRWPAAHRGALLGIRVVVPLEVDRIRQ
jgi:hypothetical protein